MSLKTPALVAYPVEAVDQIPRQASVQTPSTAIERELSAARQTLPSGSVTAPVAPAETDSKADSTDSLTITSGDENSFYDQNYSGDSQGSSNFPRNAIIYRKNGTRWVIRDPKILSEAQAIFRPQDELGKQQAALGAQLAKLGEAQADLGAQQAVFADRKLEPAQMQALQQQLGSLEENIRSLATDRVEKTTSEAQGSSQICRRSLERCSRVWVRNRPSMPGSKPNSALLKLSLVGSRRIWERNKTSWGVLRHVKRGWRKANCMS